MYDIFISYSNDDQMVVSRLVKAFKQKGWSVWWAGAIQPGQSFDREIERAVRNVKCVVVVWSKTSVESNWVRAEAEEGKNLGRLIPARIDDADIPLSFKLIQTADLQGWRDAESHEGFDQLVNAIETVLETSASSPVETIEQDIEPSNPDQHFSIELTTEETIAEVATSEVREVTPRSRQWIRRIVVLTLTAMVMAFLWWWKSPDESSISRVRKSIKPSEYASAFYERSYALVIGINHYDDGKTLSYAVEDAKRIASFLEQQNFDVIRLYNEQATKDAITYQLQNYLAPKLKPGDRVLVFFSGYGGTEKVNGKEIGYIVPYDGKGYSASYITLNNLRSLSDRLATAKHQLFLLSTNVGDLPSTTSNGFDKMSPDYIDQITTSQARQILSLGGSIPNTQQSQAQSSRAFTQRLVEVTQTDQADTNKDCYVDFGELVDYLSASSNILFNKGAFLTHNLGEFAFRMCLKTLDPTQLEARIKDETKPLCGLDLYEADLPKSLRGRNLREASLNEKVLDNVDLTGADLRGAVLSKASLLGTRLDGADLRRAILEDAILSGASLVNADLRRAVLKSAYLGKTPPDSKIHRPGANLRNANLLDADLSFANLRDAQLDPKTTKIEKKWLDVWRILTQGPPKELLDIGRDLSESNLIRANLSGIDLSGRDLKGAHLDRAILKEAELIGANLSGASLFETQLQGADLEQANLSGTNLARAYLNEALMRDTNLSGVIIDSQEGVDPLKNLPEGALGDSYTP